MYHDMAQYQRPCTQMVRLYFWSTLILRKSPTCQGLAQSKSCPGNNMAIRRSHLLYGFLITIHLHLASFCAKEYFWKTKLLGEMLIEQIIEFEWRGLGLFERTCTLTTGYFHVKTEIAKESLRVDYYLLLKFLQNSTPNPKS